MTTQEAYEGIRAWFSDPSHEPGFDTELDQCMYRGGALRDSQQRCAVGCLIPDELYDSALDRDMNDARAVMEFSDGLRELFTGVNDDFLMRAQSVHDDNADEPTCFRENFIPELDSLAESYELVIPKGEGGG